MATTTVGRTTIQGATTVGGFNPATLFSAGEQGVWYDPSDFSTLFQDSAGTIPVTALEQPVGRMLDKSGRGNHATQATSANRPVVSARVNLLTYTEQFNNPYWSNFQSTITADQTIAPNGTTTADLLTTTSTFGSVSAAALSAGTFSISIYAKAGTGTSFAIDDSLGGNGRRASFTLSGSGSTSGVSVLGTGGTSSGGSASITSVGNGWYRCVFSGVTNSSGVRPIFGCLDNLSTVYIWGADLRPANQGVGLPVYQRVGAAVAGTSTTAGNADYDANGFPVYLSFDGGDTLATSSINFTATDKASIWSAARITTAAANAALYGLSTAPLSNNGSFVLRVSNATTMQYILNGTSISDGTAAISSIPSTNIFAHLMNIAAGGGLQNGLKVNGAAIGYSGNSAGSGFLGNNPLYVMSLGSGNFMSGNLYGLIVRGASSTANQITGAENWLNQKTAAY